MYYLREFILEDYFNHLMFKIQNTWSSNWLWTWGIEMYKGIWLCFKNWFQLFWKICKLTLKLMENWDFCLCDFNNLNISLNKSSNCKSWSLVTRTPTWHQNPADGTRDASAEPCPSGSLPSFSQPGLPSSPEVCPDTPAPGAWPLPFGHRLSASCLCAVAFCILWCFHFYVYHSHYAEFP